MLHRKYTKDILEDAVKLSFSYSGVLRFLNLKQAGGTQSHIKGKIQQFNINTDHFTGQGHNIGKVSLKKISATEILVKDRLSHGKEKTFKLLRSLIEIGREYKCEWCDNTGIQNGLEITLHIDHIDGDNRNNLDTNLRFLCPNCHSQTSTYGSKNIGKCKNSS